MIRPLLITLVLFLSFGCADSSNKGGNEGPGGGDVRAQEATTLFAEIVAAVGAAPERFPEFSVRELEQAIARAKVVMRPHTYANGVETDASNNGLDLIELNESRWPTLERNQKVVLMFHELLGLMKLEKNSYAISNRLLRADARFATEVSYMCEGGCSVDIIYDYTQKALLVRATSNRCDDYFNWGILIYRGGGASKSFRRDFIPGEPKNHFLELSLMDRDMIYFSGDLYPRWPKKLFCEKTR